MVVDGYNKEVREEVVWGRVEEDEVSTGVEEDEIVGDVNSSGVGEVLNVEFTVVNFVDVVVVRGGMFGSLIDMSEHPTKCSWTGPHPTQLRFVASSKP